MSDSIKKIKHKQILLILITLFHYFYHYFKILDGINPGIDTG